ncbi:MAG UNVERIFIED_CONTAM: Re/Si-specific NAD(P)(+) transhydrogenase subunit alpha [Rickettsiaceae bacterium]|jgi:NAD(P) transhydrogenase subunit alpha
MKIAVLKEKAEGETRVAVTPDVAALFIKAGFSVSVEKGAGVSAGFNDEAYKKSGASISSVPLEIVSDADIVLKVQPTPIEDKVNETEFLKKGAAIIGFLSPHNNKFLTQTYAEKNITSLAMELVPRITKAQSMDALSSQTNLAGYRAVIESSYHFKRGFPMLMTAAGTVAAAKVLVLGAGVAGLQAIATAKRLGAIVHAYDVRPAVKEQVESVGAKFIQVEGSNFESKGGYAAEVTKEYMKKQEEVLAEFVARSDVVITTAQIPGKKAPELISKEMVNSMNYGSVIVDMAASTGGNVALSEVGKVISYNGITIIGYSNLAQHIPYDASRLYAKNLYNLVMHIFKDKKLNTDDEIVASMLLTHKGKILSTIIG